MKYLRKYNPKKLTAFIVIPVIIITGILCVGLFDAEAALDDFLDWIDK